MPIRQHRPFADTFVKEFQNSLLASPVPLAEVIPWEEIESTVETKADILPIIEDQRDPEEFLMREFILDEQANRRCNLLFELLRFQNGKILSREVTWDLTEIEFSDLASERSEEFAADLAEVGAHRLLQTRDGLEGHLEQYELSQYNHDPNRTGKYFERLVSEELQAVTDALPATTYLVPDDRIDVQVDTEPKVFDYVLYKDNEPRIVFEAKYFQRFGSKAQELIRLFDRLSTKLRNAGIEFVWIADGEGWKEAPNSIEKAYKSVIDIYNSDQVATSLEGDVRESLHHGPAVAEDEVKLDRDTNLRDFE